MKPFGWFVLIASLHAREWDRIPLASIRVDNRVSSCLTLKPEAVVKFGANVVALDASVTAQKNLGGCGCRSALLRYQVSDGPDRLTSTSAVISTLASTTGVRRSVKLVLSGDGSIRYKEPVVVTIECQP